MKTALTLVCLSGAVLPALCGQAQAGPCGYRQQVQRAPDGHVERKIDDPNTPSTSDPGKTPTVAGNALVDHKAAASREEGC
jgi:hypothetical protein